VGDVFFYLDESGQKQDASLHEEILSAGDKRFKSSQAYQDTIRYAVENLGLTEKEAKELFG
jgi:hypothetical protein